MSPRNLLIRGLLAGLLAGLATFAVAYVVGEPQVDAAIAIEEHGAMSHHHDDAMAMAMPHEHMTEVSRHNQSTWGLATGTFSVAIALGGVVALVTAFAIGRIGRLQPSQTTALVALIGFVSMFLVPFLKYPATPPAVGSAETIGARTGLYFAMMLISVSAAVLATIGASRLLRRDTSTFRAVVLPAAAYVVVVVVAGTMLATVNEVGDFPADILWSFRRASLLTNATMWATIGVTLSGLVGRLCARERLEVARRELAASI